MDHSLSETTTSWLLNSLLRGEPETWASLAKPDLPSGLPIELSTLAKKSDGHSASLSLAELSILLRKYAIQQSTASASVAIAATTMLRLSALGHDDASWAALMPRWLVPSLAPEVRGIGILALAVNSRERLAADDFSQLMDEALHLLPRESGLRAAHLHQFALYLGLRGMLRRIKDLVDLPHPGDPEPDVEPTLLAECLYDAVCNGRTAQASFLAQRIESTPEAAWQLGLIQLHRNYIPLFSAILAGSTLPEDDLAPSTPIVRALLTDDAHQLDDFNPQAHRGEISPLLGYDALRVALARRDVPQARELLAARNAGLERHWLDDVFLARLLLLEDQPTEAGEAFARVEAAAHRFGGLERLEIELRLAVEMSRHDCCRLGLAAAGTSPSGLQAAIVLTPSTQLAEALLSGTSAAVLNLRQALARLQPGADTRVLLSGPNDGSRRILAALIHDRLGGGAQHRLSATAHVGMSELADGLLAAANGSLIIDNAEQLNADLQQWLVDRLDSGLPCRLIVCASTQLNAAVDCGHWRPDLYWPFAARRIAIPALAERRDDLPALTTALLRTLGSHARCEASAFTALVAMPLSGGWAELRALCTLLAAERPLGTIDGEAVLHARATLDGAR